MMNTFSISSAGSTCIYLKSESWVAVESLTYMIKIILVASLPQYLARYSSLRFDLGRKSSGIFKF